jgi:signal peptidase I
MRVNERQASVMRRIVRWSVSLSLIAAAALYVTCDLLVVQGSSMENTIRSGQRVAVVRADVLSSIPGVAKWLLTRDRIVVFRSPLGLKDLLIKRIVATEGDTVRLQNETLIVNDRVVSEPWGVVPFDFTWPPPKGGRADRSIVVPKNHYFVLSDNRLQQLDSRAFGSVPNSLIVGVVVSGMMTSRR